MLDTHKGLRCLKESKGPAQEDQAAWTGGRQGISLFAGHGRRRERIGVDRIMWSQLGMILLDLGPRIPKEQAP